MPVKIKAHPEKETQKCSTSWWASRVLNFTRCDWKEQTPCSRVSYHGKMAGRHGPFLCGSSILKSEWHDNIAVGSPGFFEWCPLLVFFSELNLVIPGESVHEWEHLVVSGLIHEDINVWQWKVASLFLFNQNSRLFLFQVSEINAKTNLSILPSSPLTNSFLLILDWVAATGGFRNWLGCAAACDRWNFNYLSCPYFPLPPLAKEGRHPHLRFTPYFTFSLYHVPRLL